MKNIKIIQELHDLGITGYHEVSYNPSYQELYEAEVSHKRKGFNIRIGYNFRRAEELKLLEQRNFSGISVGFGLKINKLKFNYSYSRYTLAANTSLFGLTINFQ